MTSEQHSDRLETTWCTLCGARFTREEIAGKFACPKCGETGIPCGTGDDISITINWHELRVLGIWAENYAQQIDARDKRENLTRTVHAITRRLQRQFPDKTPLTLSGELMTVREQGYDIETHGVAKSQPLPVNGPGAVLPMKADS